MTGELYLGLDLTTSSHTPTAYGVLDEGLELAGLGSLGTDQEILDCARRLSRAVIAIDAPLFLPLGLCCLEAACPCRQVFPGLGRRAERALSAERVSAYYVTKRTFIRELIYRGMSLAGSLRVEGYDVIEVYPYASQVRLFGKLKGSRHLAPNKAILRQKLTERIPSLHTVGPPLSLDKCDALLAAYTAYLYRRGLTEAIGHAQEGLMPVPQKRAWLLG